MYCGMTIHRTDGLVVHVKSEPEDNEAPMCEVRRGSSTKPPLRLNKLEFEAAKEAHARGQREVSLNVGERYVDIDETLKRQKRRRASY